MKRRKLNFKAHLLHDAFHVLVKSSKFMWSSISVNVAKLKYFKNFFFKEGSKLYKHQILCNLSLALKTVHVYRSKISKAIKSEAKLRLPKIYAHSFPECFTLL